MQITFDRTIPRHLPNVLPLAPRTLIAITLAATLAIGLLAIAITYAVKRLQKRDIVQKNASSSTDLPSGFPFRLTPRPAFDVNFDPAVKPALDRLFENSAYTIDTLPVYPFVLNKESEPLPLFEKMDSTVMKGKMDDGRPFIAIKLICELTPEDLLVKIPEELAKCLNDCRLEKILMLYQYHTSGPLFWGGDGKNLWDQAHANVLEPSFFTGNFTYAENGKGPTTSQTKNFAALQILLTTGQSPDTRGLTWKLVND